MDETRVRPGMTHEQAIEVAARDCASSNGDAWDDVPESKTQWNRERGMFGGRYRDINEPFRDDYRDMARAAITAFLAHVEVSEGITDTGYDAFDKARERFEADPAASLTSTALDDAFRAMLAQLAREIASG